MAGRKLIMGIDGGGSNTRVIIASPDGDIAAYIEDQKAASQHRDNQATDNFKTAIRKALSVAGCSPGEICGMAAGIAGYDRDQDLEWVKELTHLPEMTCPKWHVNDAVAAHYGALMAKPGVVVISGTGSIIFGINEEGQYIRNYDYHHYAASAARFLAYDAVYEAIAGHTDDTDGRLVHDMLSHWNAADLGELALLGRNGFHDDRRERDRGFGAFAPYVTEAAAAGSSLAQAVCDRSIHQIVVGIRLLGRHFQAETLRVACIGSVANSTYFQGKLKRISTDDPGRPFRLMDPHFPPVVGSFLYAMEQLGIPVTDSVLSKLERTLNVTNRGIVES
ncbi:glucosamine kinase [Paenibacillus favisporus]|uniref:Glucosamine kinase n=1 Tax=Paenibacillus favisporus TaxID=221028 RepID=A0ABV2F4X9_9BACL